MDRLSRKFETREVYVPRPAVSDGTGAKVGVIAYGSSDFAVEEARVLLGRKGLQTDYLRLRALPFTPETSAFIAAHDRVYVIDQNRDGQMYDLLRLEIGGDTSRLRSIRHYDGFPLDAETVIEGIEAGGENLMSTTAAAQGASHQPRRPVRQGVRRLQVDALRGLRPRRHHAADHPGALRDVRSRRTRSRKCRGIGCSSKTHGVLPTAGHGFNAVHGRMPAVATGAMMANPSLLAVGVSGDGDTASIGVGQFVHLLRRNVPMVYIVENNGVYGLTKGQFSATADAGSKLKTGAVNDLPAIDLCAMAIQLGCGYVARSFSGDMKQLVALLKGALAHRGTALLDIVSPCVTFNNHDSSTKSYKWAKDHEIPIHEIGFVPYYEDISVDYDPGTTQDVELHDGSHIRLRKLRADYDATDKGQALALCLESGQKQEFLTGLIYVEPTKKDFLELSGLSRDPIVSLPESKLRPPRQALEEIMESLK